MLKTFDCPKCGAPVTYERPSDLSVTKSTVRCDYCHSQLIAPNELAGQPARVVRIQFAGLSGAKFPKWIWLLLAIPLVVLVLVGLGAVGILAPAFYSVSRTVKESNTPAPPNVPPMKKSNAFARVLLTFGSEGIGAGMFTDARSIALDGDGWIYVGEYMGGRIQVFDPAGQFISQWNIGDRKTILRGFAADRKGTVYAAHGGRIALYQGDTGIKLGELEYKQSGFDDVTAAADGG